MTKRDELIQAWKDTGEWESLDAGDRMRIEGLDETTAACELEWLEALGLISVEFERVASGKGPALPLAPPPTNWNAYLQMAAKRAGLPLDHEGVVKWMINRPFPAQTVINSFLFVEELLKECLSFIPYPEQAQTWSPRLATVILEACTQLDSLWHSMAVEVGSATADQWTTMKDYVTWHAGFLAPRWIVFFGGNQPCLLLPFQSWRSTPPATPAWWDAYNDLKHDRWINRSKATAKNAVNAVGALCIVLVTCDLCTEAVYDSEWLTLGMAPSALEGLSHIQHYMDGVAETGLFAYPYDYHDREIMQNQFWASEASSRFMRWFSTYSQPGKPR